MQTVGGHESQPGSTHYLCLDLLLALVSHMTSRAEGVGVLTYSFHRSIFTD